MDIKDEGLKAKLQERLKFNILNEIYTYQLEIEK